MTKPLARIDLDGKTMTLFPGGRLRIGRAIDNEIVLGKRSVSRYHARLSWPQGSALPVLQDLGSQNGTRLNGVVLQSPKPVGDGSRICFEPFQLLVRLENVSETPAIVADDSAPMANPLDDRPSMAGLVSFNGGGRELLLMLEQEERTGTLSMGKERILVCMGRVMIRTPEDRQSVLRMAVAKPGTYYNFNPEFDVQSSCSRQLLWPSHVLGEERPGGLRRA